MRTCAQILIKVVDKWNETSAIKLPDDFIGLLDFTIRITQENTYQDLKEKVLSLSKIAADSKNFVNLETLEFIINKL